MQFSNHRSRAARGSIVYLAVDAIAPSAVQPRQNFSPAQLEELSRSIAEYGVLSPLTVRPRQGGYELVAGERRLRAARMAGLHEVPCIIMELDLEEASFIALVENLQRNDLDFLEEARGIAQLIRLFGLSQEECARRLGKSQSAVANKLRLLRLPEDVLNAMRNAGLADPVRLALRRDGGDRLYAQKRRRRRRDGAQHPRARYHARRVRHGHHRQLRVHVQAR